MMTPQGFSPLSYVRGAWRLLKEIGDEGLSLTKNYVLYVPDL